MHPKMNRLVFKPLRQVCRMALRIFITGLISIICFMLVSRALGLPVLTPSELLDKFKNVSRLAEILS
jgi:hypothetical protein